MPTKPPAAGSFHAAASALGDTTGMASHVTPSVAPSAAAPRDANGAAKSWREHDTALAGCAAGAHAGCTHCGPPPAQPPLMHTRFTAPPARTKPGEQSTLHVEPMDVAVQPETAGAGALAGDSAAHHRPYREPM